MTKILTIEKKVNVKIKDKIYKLTNYDLNYSISKLLQKKGYSYYTVEELKKETKIIDGLCEWNLKDYLKVMENYKILDNSKKLKDNHIVADFYTILDFFKVTYSKYNRGYKLVNGVKKRFTSFVLNQKIPQEMIDFINCQYKNVEFGTCQYRYAKEIKNDVIYLFDNCIGVDA